MLSKSGVCELQSLMFPPVLILHNANTHVPFSERNTSLSWKNPKSVCSYVGPCKQTI